MAGPVGHPSGSAGRGPSGVRRAGRWAPLAGGRRGRAEPRLRAAAARSCPSSAHHLPPRRLLSPPRPGGLGREPGRASGLAAADSSRHAPGGRRGGGRVVQERAAPAGKQLESGRRSPASQRRAAARRAGSSRLPEGTSEGSGGSARAVRSFRHRCRSEPGAPAGAGREVVPGGFSWTPAPRESQRGHGKAKPLHDPP